MLEIKFYVVVVADGGDPELKTFESIEGLTNFLRNLPKTVHGFAFHGHWLQTTAGPWRYLLTEAGPLPLFEPPKVGKVDRSARLGHKADESGEDSAYQQLVETLPPPVVEVEGEAATLPELPDS